MSTSSADCVASPTMSRTISNSGNIHSTSALVSIMPQPSCSLSAATMAQAHPNNNTTATTATGTTNTTITDNPLNTVSRDEEFLCPARDSYTSSTDSPPFTPRAHQQQQEQQQQPHSPDATPPKSRVRARTEFKSPAPSAPTLQHAAAEDEEEGGLTPTQPRSKSVAVAPSCEFAQRLRTAVQQQRSGAPPLDTTSNSGRRARVTAKVTVAEDNALITPVAGDEGGHASTRVKSKLTPGCPRPYPIPSPSAAAAIPPAAAAAAAATLRRYTTSAVGGITGNEANLVDAFNISALAHCAFNRSVASITTRPPATASNELVRRKENGNTYINNYRILKTLGRGACGKVKLGYDEDLKRKVAIKTVRRADTRKRIGGLTVAQKQFNAFMQEAQVMKKLRHRNIVSLYEVIDDPSADKLYLVMQYVDKGVIAKVEVRANSDRVCEPIPPTELARYAREMLTGLQYLHQHEVVHRDLKPDNILVSKDGHAYLADFGVAEAFDTSYRQRIEALMAQSMAMSMAMSVAGGRAGGPQVLGTKGTPLFIAPELWNGDKSYGKPVDMWAMGVTLYTLLVGKLPFASPEDITDAKCTPEVPQEFGEKWRTLLNGLLSRDPKARWTVEKARGFVKLCLDGAVMTTTPRKVWDVDAPPATRAASLNVTTLAPASSAAAPTAPHTHDSAASRAEAEKEGGSASTPCHSESLRSADTARSQHATQGWEENAISLSDLGSNVLGVDFLPMPDRVEETPSPELTVAPVASPPAVNMMPVMLTVPDEKAAEADKDEEPTSALVSGFTSPSPFEAAQGIACVISPTLRSVASQYNASGMLTSPLGAGQSGTMMPLPPMVALQRLPTTLIGDQAAPRGRRSNHHRHSTSNHANGNASSNNYHHSTTANNNNTTVTDSHNGLSGMVGGSSHHLLHLGRSSMRSKSRDTPHTAAVVHGAQHAAAAAAALAAQHREMSRLASPQSPMPPLSSCSSATTSAGAHPQGSPTTSLHPSFGRIASRNALPTTDREREAPKDEDDDDDEEEKRQHRRISTMGTQQLMSMEGIVIPSPSARSTNGMSVDNMVVPMTDKAGPAGQRPRSDSQRIQASNNGDRSAPSVNRVA